MQKGIKECLIEKLVQSCNEAVSVYNECDHDNPRLSKPLLLALMIAQEHLLANISNRYFLYLFYVLYTFLPMSAKFYKKCMLIRTCLTIGD